MKTHKLKTIKDILDVVDEKNIKAFLNDFRDWLVFKTAVKKADKAIEKIGAIVKMKNENTMTWIDDGKNNSKITIEISKSP